MNRFIAHVGSEHLEKFGEEEVAEFLTELAVSGNVVGITQNQALSAILFLYGQVLNRDSHRQRSLHAPSGFSARVWGSLLAILAV